MFVASITLLILISHSWAIVAPRARVHLSSHVELPLEEDHEDTRSNRTISILRSKSEPRWMVVVGGSQEDLEVLTMAQHDLRPKSVQMNFEENGEVPIPIVLFDELPNLSPIALIAKMRFDELKQKQRERAALGQVLIEACGSEAPNGDLIITSGWSEDSAVESDVIMTEDQQVQTEVADRLTAGFIPVGICGFTMKATKHSHYLIVFLRPFHPPPNFQPRVQVQIGQNFSDCVAQDRQLASRGLNAQRMHIHRSGVDELKCASIYAQIPGARHFISRGPTLKAIYDRVLQKPNGRRYVPKSVSRIVYPPMVSGDTGLTGRLVSNPTEEFVVLWSNTPIWSLPPPRPFQTVERGVPFQYLPGVVLELPAQLLTFVNNRVVEFMQKFDLPGVSIALAKNERLKLAAGFGFANLKTGQQITPLHKMRLGSIAKVVTATAIMLMVEERQLNLEERVFGLNSIFGFDFADSNGQLPPFVDQITVRHLLGHTVGAWGNNGIDPVFKSEFNSTAQVIRDTLANQVLQQPPGQQFLYSNFGYLLLGEIIAKRSGQSYVEFVNRRLFLPVGLQQQTLFNPRFDFADENGVLYYPTAENNDDPYELPDALILAACCGWSMTPTELLKFVTHADGFTSKPDLISAEAFHLIGTPTRESNFSYGLGWSVNERGFNGRSHQGQMPSALSILVRTDSGIEIVIATNRFPPRAIALPEIAYLAHHLVSLFEGPETVAIDHFLALN
ncbi:hypothetical protein M3Y94_00661300 [Aphelenchoides besseyi]|nr:hypothetical protein M3Y94_00661300 [Aphelenchoides besseyi]KAI6231248.1 Beta-lactamase domain-containing protein [Aphelenchoides besseyi]